MFRSSGGEGDGYWQRQIEAYCEYNQLQPPFYYYLSNARGGRTAWTARVLVNCNLYQARFFYDGHRNAREDAAEVALYHLTPKIHAAASQSYSGRLYPYEYDLHERQWPMTQELKRYEKHYYY